jgi:hypothetical protein
MKPFWEKLSQAGTKREARKHRRKVRDIVCKVFQISIDLMLSSSLHQDFGIIEHFACI